MTDDNFRARRRGVQAPYGHPISVPGPSRHRGASSARNRSSLRRHLGEGVRRTDDGGDCRTDGVAGEHLANRGDRHGVVGVGPTVGEGDDERPRLLGIVVASLDCFVSERLDRRRVDLGDVDVHFASLWLGVGISMTDGNPSARQRDRVGCRFRAMALS